MKGTLYLAWRYVAYHRFKTAVLVTAITLILYLPVGLRVLVGQGQEQLTARAEATPLVVGAKGSPLELVLNTLYFGGDSPEVLGYAEAARIAAYGMAQVIPMNVRFRVQDRPIVGTDIEYLAFRDLRVVEGRRPARLGECIVGARAARVLGVTAGDHVVSSPESVFDLAGVYPLKMAVVGVLGYSGTADDDAVFVDIRTTWVIQGLGHGHQDLSRPEASAGVLAREGSRVTANASVVQYNEITDANVGSFHFHGNDGDYPITSLIVAPRDAKASALLRGRFQSPDEPLQIVPPVRVMDDLLGTVVKIQGFVTVGAGIVGIATLATTALVFTLSLRLRRRELTTLFKLGGSRAAVAVVTLSEIIAVLVASVALSAALTLATHQLGPAIVRAVVRM